MNDGFVVPHNMEAEKTLISCGLMDGQLVSTIAEAVKPEDFYTKRHAAIFEAMCALDEAGKPVVMSSVADTLKARGTLELAGGMTYLATLLDFATTAVNMGYFIETVNQTAMLRRLMDAGKNILRQCSKPGAQADGALEAAEADIFAINQHHTGDKNLKSVKAITNTCLDKINAAITSPQSITGLSTGFSTLDAQLGGLQNSDLLILAARPSMGKTALALNITQNVSDKSSVPVLFFSLEMSSEQLVNRMISAKACVDCNSMRTGRLSETARMQITNAAASISGTPLFIDDTAAQSVAQMRSKARRFKAQRGIGLVVIDYIQLIQPAKRRGNRTEDVSEISRGLKILAKELDVPVIALSQLNRSVEQRPDKRPVLSDLRESGAIEQDADVVMFLTRPDYYGNDERPGLTEVIFAKQRNGPVGLVEMMFEARTTSFRDMGLTDK